MEVVKIIVDMVGGTAIFIGCSTSGLAGCLEGIGYAIGYDYALTTLSPLGWVENFLGVGSLGITGIVDLRSGNTGFTENGFQVGIDTLISARNMIAGFFPEANIDAIVSNSQLKYDLDRLLGNKPGGSIPIIINGSLNHRELFKLIFTEHWW